MNQEPQEITARELFQIFEDILASGHVITGVERKCGKRKMYGARVEIEGGGLMVGLVNLYETADRRQVYVTFVTSGVNEDAD